MVGLSIDDGLESLIERPLTHYCFAESMTEALEKYFADPVYCGNVFRITIEEDPSEHHENPDYRNAQR